MKAPLIHVASLLFNEPLAIMPAKLETILRAIGPRLVVDDSSLNELMRLHSIQQRPVLLEDAVLFDAQAPRQSGDGENDKPYKLTPEGIAVIPMRGSLMKRYNFMAAASGLTTYQGLAQAATAAMTDPQVKGILFDIDSPGGTTHGCFELSDMIYQMRGSKPMWACANDLAASAAYALASAADQIWVTRTAGVGSVGVFALHADQSGMDEQAGVKFTYVFAGERKIDGNPHEPLSKSAKADIQAEVDREHGIFIATVARNRGGSVNFEKIQATKAGVYFAQNAVPLLADVVGTYEEALEALTAKVNGTKAISSGKVAILGESGNTTVQSTGAEEVEKKGVTMPKPVGEELRRAKEADAEATKAAEPKDDEDEDDQPEDDEKEKEAKGKKAARPVAVATNQDDDDDRPARRDSKAEAKRIAELCQIAGAPELAATYLIAGYNVDKVVEKLSARRAKASAEGNVNSFVSDGAASGEGRVSVDAAIKQATIMAANSGEKRSKCMEKILRANPDIYTNYMEEKDEVMIRTPSGHGRVLDAYVLNTQRRYLANLGLSTAIEDVPVRRAM